MIEEEEDSVISYKGMEEEKKAEVDGTGENMFDSIALKGQRAL